MLWIQICVISLWQVEEISLKNKKRPYVPVAYFRRWQLCDNNDVLDMWRHLTLCLMPDSGVSFLKTLLHVVFCHMAVFSCCDVGTIVIEEVAPNLHKQTLPAGPSNPPSGAWHSSSRVRKWYFSTWAPGIISWRLLLGAKCMLVKLHHQMVPETLALEDHVQEMVVLVLTYLVLVLFQVLW